MAEFKSWRSYQDFRDSVIREHRYCRNSSQERFLLALEETSKGREQVCPKGTVFWRARLGNDWLDRNPDIGEEGKIEVPWSPAEMKPLSDRASEGRANPKGIPCLYVATDKETAMAEVRPWVGAYVSISQLQTTRELKVLDLTRHRASLKIYFEEPDLKTRESEVWSAIDRAFSTPITNDDQTAKYVPTQVLAEFFRLKGLDAIAYGSSLGDGRNFAFFDLSCAEVINGSLFEVKDIRFSFAEVANPYVVSHASSRQHE